MYEGSSGLSSDSLKNLGFDVSMAPATDDMDTWWGTQDFLIVDLPPGAGEAQLTLAQQVALDGAVIVTRRRTSRCSTRRGRRGCCISCIARSSAWSRT
jgi:hypothetical protein